MTIIRTGTNHTRSSLPFLIWMGVLATSEAFRVAFIVKNLQNPFFEAAYEGCKEEAILQTRRTSGSTSTTTLGSKPPTIYCDYLAPDTLVENTAAGQLQNDILLQIIQNTTTSSTTSSSHGDGTSTGTKYYYDAVAISPFDAEGSTPYINQVMEAGIPIVTYDTDAIHSKRIIHIGTDNTAFGEMLGKVLLQFAPLGGTYGTLAGFPAPNIAERVQGLQQFLNGTTWTYAGPPDGVDGKGSSNTSIVALRNLMEDHPDIDALVPVVGWPMWNVQGWKEFATEFNDLTFVAGDASPSQIELLELGYADGLVGQLPSDMGRQSLKTLLTILNGDETPSSLAATKSSFLKTNLLQFLLVPLILPKVELKNNFLGRVKWLSYVLFFLIFATVVCLAVWTWKYKKSRVVSSSQPIFLYLILVGTLIMSATILTLTVDEETTDTHTNICDIACNLNIWFLTTGFTLVFAALFSKTWRLNKIIHASRRLKRVTIKIKDVLLPLVVLLIVNTTVLLSWTFHGRLRQVTKTHKGTDAWNRPISYYSLCDSDYSVYYSTAIFLVSFVSLIMTLVQAYQARQFRTAFDESNYVGIVTVCILQASIIGVLIFVLTKDQPRVMVPLISLILFFVSMAILLFIFIPKVLSHREEVTMKFNRRKGGFRNTLQYGLKVAPRSKEVFNIERDLRGGVEEPKVVMYGPRKMEEEKIEEVVFPIKQASNNSTDDKVFDTSPDNVEPKSVRFKENDPTLEAFPDLSKRTIIL